MIIAHVSRGKSHAVEGQPATFGEMRHFTTICGKQFHEPVNSIKVTLHEGEEFDCKVCEKRAEADAKCHNHPGRENHCVSGACGECWRCKELVTGPLAPEVVQELASQMPPESRDRIDWAIRELEPLMHELAEEMVVMEARVRMPEITAVMDTDAEMASRILALDPDVSMAQVRRTIRHHGRVTHIRALRRRAKKEGWPLLTQS